MELEDKKMKMKKHFVQIGERFKKIWKWLRLNLATIADIVGTLSLIGLVLTCCSYCGDRKKIEENQEKITKGIYERDSIQKELLKNQYEARQEIRNIQYKMLLQSAEDQFKARNFDNAFEKFYNLKKFLNNDTTGYCLFLEKGKNYKIPEAKKKMLERADSLHPKLHQNEAYEELKKLNN
ncbi:hypothetical protein FACS189426_11190 [Bacteroidia bacterium]|nr:hypothetical protein FACS189426_11190 [Bacteroidia bacterium]